MNSEANGFNLAGLSCQGLYGNPEGQKFGFHSL